MSQYLCPECDQGSKVIETRPSHRRLRRRRICENGHRFSTTEVPLEASQELSDLVDWALKNGASDTDTANYMKSEIKRIIHGIEEEDYSDELRSENHS